MVTQVILGSQSPRRREILSYFSLPFETTTPEFDEESVDFTGDPIAHANALALGKARSLTGRFPNAAILTADTLVFREGKIYGKPRDEQEAFAVLKELAGTWHSVYTGVALVHGNDEFVQTEETRVLFNNPPPEQLQHYHQSLHCFDKAGGYAIQAAGSLIVKRIEGCYYNVMGLPINTVNELLSKVNLTLWDYL